MTLKYYVVEHKTTSSDIEPGSPYYRRLRLDSQNSNYIYGAQSLGYVPDGVLYDVIRKPTIRQYQATPIESRKYKKDGELYANQRENDESEDDFRIRLRYDIQSEPEKYFARSMVVRMKTEERDAQADEWETAIMLRQCEKSHRWARNPDACDQYGSLCQYFDVCTGVTSIDDDARFSTVRAHSELENPTLQPKRLPVVTTSSLRAFRSCPRRYFYSYVVQRRAREASFALRFGTLFHVGLEHLWRSNFDLSFALGEMSNFDRELDDYDLIKAEELLRGYWARWSVEPYQVIGVETEFVAPLVNPETAQQSRTYQRSGKIDALIAVEE